MVEYLAKKIDSKRVLRSNIDKYKEYFIKFYGESERERIEEAFSKILLIPYMRPFEADILFNELHSIELQKEITSSILKRYSKSLKPDELEGNGDFSHLDGFNLYQYTQLVEELNKEEKDEEKIHKLFRDLKSLLEKIDNGITPSNFFNFSDNPIYQELEHLSKNFPIMQQEFDEISSKFKSYETSILEEWKQEAITKRKWQQEFIRSNLTKLSKDLPENIKEDLEKYFASGGKEISESIVLIFGREIENSSSPNNFMSEQERQEMEKAKEKDKKDCKLELQKEHFICKQYQKELAALGLLNPLKLEEEMLTGITACLPNVRKVNGKYDIFCPVLICFKQSEEGSIDHNIIHELNHLLELTLLDANDEGYSILSGWDLINYRKDESKDESKEKKFRTFELFNEAINELIAQDICKEMHNDGFFLFDREKTEYDQNGYVPTLYLVEEFYEKYKDKILESRRDGNIDIIWDTVGKENFLALNSLFEIHCDAKTGDLREISSEEKAEQERKKDIILSRMEEYSKTSLEETNIGKNK